jgi:hypothetical protein
MKRAIGQILKKSFKLAMKRRCPEFVEMHDAVVPEDALVFRWDAHPELSVFLILVTWSREDKFTIEGAWSRNGRFPSDERLSSPRDRPYHGAAKDESAEGRSRFRIPRLWMPRGEYWWEIVPSITPEEMIERIVRHVQTTKSEEPTIEQLRDRIEATVADAIDRVIDHFIPYCRSLLADASTKCEG